MPSESAWGEYVRRGAFREAIPLIEHDLATQAPDGKSEQDRCLEKLWWVRAQLATEGMPLTALTTPLSELLEPAKTLPEIAEFCCSTFYLLARQLANKKQTRLATVFLDHTLEFAAPLANGDRQALRNYASAVFREEIERAENKREPETYVSKLKSRLAELEREEQSPSPGERNGAIESKRLGPLSAKAIRDADFSQKTIREEDETAEPERIKSTSSSSNQFTGFVLGVSCVLLLLLAWKLGFETQQEEAPIELADSKEASPAHTMTTPPVSAPPAATAQPTEGPGVFTGTNAQAQAKAVDTNLDSLGARLKNVVFKGIDKPKTADDVRKDPEVDQTALTGKEAANLSNKTGSNQSADELASLEGEKPVAPAPTIDPRKVPLLDPNRLGEPQSTEVAPPVNPRSVQPANAERSDRDSIHPSLPSFGGPPDPKGKTLDGTPLQAYPVERLSQPRIFRTITETKVFTAPSLLAETVARLPVDTSVQVMSHVGQWLEIRSLGGRRGFIYAQNATPSANAPAEDTHALDHLD